jgi:mannose-6-phosphate isomerase-like protein (cupin superfamily)
VPIGTPSIPPRQTTSVQIPIRGGRRGIVSNYSIVHVEDVEDSYGGSDVPGEFRSLKEALGAEQLAVTLIRVPPNSDFEQGTGHCHKELEEIYIITRGVLTMRFEDEVEEVKAGSVVRVAPATTRSHRNEGSEPVEIWAVSRKIEEGDSTKVEDFWEASPAASQSRSD